MHLDGWTLVLQTVNFAVLVWLLQRFLYRPVLRLLDVRRAQDAQQAEAAERALAQAQLELADATAQRDGIEAERRAALQAAAAQAEQLVAARQTQAERDAATLLASARKTLADERAQALAEAHRSAFELGVTIAQRLFAELPATLRAEALLAQVTNYLTQLPAAQRQELVSAGEHPTLQVVTAQALSDAEQSDWRARIQQALDHELVIAFVAEPALIAGAELHFAHAIAHFSWRQALATMRGQDSDRDDAR